MFCIVESLGGEEGSRESFPLFQTHIASSLSSLFLSGRLFALPPTASGTIPLLYWGWKIDGSQREPELSIHIQIVPTWKRGKSSTANSNGSEKSKRYLYIRPPQWKQSTFTFFSFPLNPLLCISNHICLSSSMDFSPATLLSFLSTSFYILQKDRGLGNARGILVSLFHRNPHDSFQ